MIDLSSAAMRGVRRDLFVLIAEALEHFDLCWVAVDGFGEARDTQAARHQERRFAEHFAGRGGRRSCSNDARRAPAAMN